MNLDELITQLIGLRDDFPDAAPPIVGYATGKPDPHKDLKLSFISPSPDDSTLVFVLNEDAPND